MEKSLIRLRKLTKTHEFGDNKIDEEKVTKEVTNILKDGLLN